MRTHRLCAIALSLLAATVVHAAPGDLDVAFGDGGVVALAPGGTNIGGYVVALPDGGVVVTGVRIEPTFLLFPDREAIVVARYGPDGSLDPSFGQGGTVELLFHPEDYIPRSAPVTIVRRPDGRLVIGGVSIDRLTGVVTSGIIQLTADGALDPAFGNGGVALLPALPSGRLVSLRLAATGDLVLGEDEVVDNQRRWVARRVHEDGALDADFGLNGIMEADSFGPVSTQLATLALWPDGSIALFGIQSPETGPVVGLGVRLRADGKIDHRFGKAGVLTLGESVWPSDATVTPDGRLVLATNAFSALRMFADGRLDTTFGDGGVAHVAFSGPADAFAMALQCDGGIVLGGEAAPDSNYRYAFALTRLTAGGRLDEEFGDHGIVQTPVGPPAVVFGLAVDPSGGLFAGGFGRHGEQFGQSLIVAHYAGGATCDLPCGQGDDRLTIGPSSIQLAVTLPLPGGSTVDPLQTGAHVVVEREDGTVVADVLAPPGAPDATTLSGWRQFANGRVWSFRDRSGSSGIRRLSLRRLGAGLGVSTRLAVPFFDLDAGGMRVTVDVPPASACTDFPADHCATPVGSRLLSCR